MPSLSFLIDERGIDLLLDRLNADPEIAFIVPEGLPENKNAEPRRGLTLIVEDGELKTEVEPPRRWKAVRTVGALPDGQNSLWHIPAGPLPLIEVKKDPMALMPLIGPKSPPHYPPIPDPWSGWIGTDQFGPGCLPWIRLEVWTRHRPYTGEERATLHQLISFWADENDKLVGFSFRARETQEWNAVLLT